VPNSHYYRARAKWAKGQLNWETDDIRGLLVTTGYVPVLDTDEFLSAVVAGNRLGTAVALAGRAVTVDGRCTASSPLTISDPPATGTAGALVLFKWVSNDSNSPLLVYMDEAISGLPVAMTGTPVQITLPAAGLLIL
jgi:hypothetical protein